MKVAIEVEGLAALKQRLRDIDDDAVAELAQGPVEGAGHIVRRAIEAKAPRRTGQLAEAIEVEHDDEIDAANVRVGTGPEGFHGLFHEFGWITAQGGQRVRAKPFMRPAFEGAKGEVQQYAVTGIRKAIERRWRGR